MKKLFLVYWAVLSATCLFAQDINFSQFYELPLLRNPGLAGTYNGDLRVTSGYRSQWGSVTTPFKTMALGAEMKMNLRESADYVSIGCQITNDVAGDSKLSRTQLLPMLTFHKSLDAEKDSYLSLGFLAGGAQQRFDVSALKFGDQFVNGAYSATNPTRQTFQNTSTLYWDATVGLAYSSTAGNDMRYYVGAALFHLAQPKVAFNKDNDFRLNKKMVFNAGLSAPTGDESRLVFYGDYFIQGGNNVAQFGLLYKYDLLLNRDNDDPISLSVGSFYRWNDALMPLVKLDYYNLGIGASYDINVSKLQPASQAKGSMEIMLSYRNFLNIRNSSYEKLRCPVAL